MVKNIFQKFLFINISLLLVRVICKGLVTSCFLTYYTSMFHFILVFRSMYYTYTLDLGILDQGAGLIVLFDDKPSDKTYENTLEIIQRMGGLVDSLYNKAKKLS